MPRCEAQNGAAPPRHRTLLREVRCRPPKWGSRVPAALAPDGDAPRTRESRPKRRGHARHARRSTLCRVVAGYHPPTRSNASHQRTTLWPSDLGESGSASRVARASQIRTKSLGRRVRHFGARNRISCYRIRWPEGPPRPGRHGELGGVLVSILRPLGRALYRSGRGRVPFRPPFC